MVVSRGAASRPWRGGFRTVNLAFLCWITAACVSTFPPELQADRTGDVSKVLENAFEEVTENYVDPIETGDLAVAGLRGLGHLEPKLDIVDLPQAVEITFDSVKFHSFVKPPASDINAWADAAAEAMIAASERSSGIRVVSLTRVYDAYMEGIAKVLGPDVFYLTDAEVRDRIFPKFNSGILFAYREVEAGLEVLHLDPAGRLTSEGLRVGDVVTQVNDVSVRSKNHWEIQQMLLGPEGSKVTLTVQEQEPQTERRVSLTRWKTQFPSYEPVNRGEISGYALPYFTVRAARDLRRKIAGDAHLAGPGAGEFDGVVLDLRRSVGGGEFAVEELANVFLGKGTVSINKGREAQPERRLNASWPNPSHNRPLIVVVDETTGAGAEIVTAALQDNGRALVIGSSTQGYGVTTKFVSLSKLGDFRMPVSRNYAPSGYGLGGRGVMPDICISGAGVTLDGLMPALRRGDGLIDLATRQRQIDQHDSVAVTEQRAVCPMEEVQAALSFDLAAAILNEPGLYQRLLRHSSIN